MINFVSLFILVILNFSCNISSSSFPYKLDRSDSKIINNFKDYIINNKSISSFDLRRIVEIQNHKNLIISNRVLSKIRYLPKSKQVIYAEPFYRSRRLLLKNLSKNNTKILIESSSLITSFDINTMKDKILIMYVNRNEYYAKLYSFPNFNILDEFKADRAWFYKNSDKINYKKDLRYYSRENKTSRSLN